ncbi:MAG: hypothetical protein QQN60_08290 [Nitrosopumilus sp.]
MTKKCPQCEKVEIEDKYSMCLNCLKGTQRANENIDVSGIFKKLEQINWNLGSISQTLKLSLLSDLESLKNTGAGRSLTQKKIYEALLKDCDKYLKVLKQIKEEQEK